MAYIREPGPSDDDVIYESEDGQVYTWGEHRRMAASLRTLGMEDEMIREAEHRLDAVLLDHGFDPHPPPADFICEHCKRKEYLVHAEDCPDYEKDLAVTREAAAYQWLNDKFEVVHQSSVCVNDEEACDYFRIVQVWFINENMKYLMRKDFYGDGGFHMLPWQYDKETGAVTPIERPKV